MNISHERLLRLIALFKFVKSALLIVLGIGALKMLHQDLSATLEHWITALRLDLGERLLDALLGKAANVSPSQMAKASLGSFVYAGLFLAEGTGLWLRKRWGEWLTVVITSSLVPIEVYEIYRHFNVVKVVVLVLNLAIVVYLIYHIRSQPEQRH